MTLNKFALAYVKVAGLIALTMVLIVAGFGLFIVSDLLMPFWWMHLGLHA